MASDLELLIRWPDNRTVNVHVDVEPDVAGRGAFGPESFPDVDDDAFYPIDAGALASRKALIGFLKEATTNEASGATIDMLLRETDEPTLLRLLGVTGPVTGPIPVDVN